MVELEKTVIKVLHRTPNNEVGQASGVIISDRHVILSAHQLVDVAQTDLLLTGQKAVAIERILFQGLFWLDKLREASDLSYATIDLAIVESPVSLVHTFVPAVIDLNPLTESCEVCVVGYPAGSDLRIARGVATSYRGNYFGISLSDQVYPGMSGGGVFNQYNKLIGIYSTSDSDDPLFVHAVYLAKVQK